MSAESHLGARQGEKPPASLSRVRFCHTGILPLIGKIIRKKSEARKSAPKLVKCAEELWRKLA